MLNRIQEILEKENLNSTLIPTSESSTQRLLVFLGRDVKNREQTLEISAQEQPFLPHLPPSRDRYYRIQFQFLFPFKVKDTAISQVASLLLFLNQLLDFPGLELNEVENQVSYRYVWLAKSNGIDAQLVISIIGIILLILELFTSTIERLADGSATFNELLTEVIQITQNIK